MPDPQNSSRILWFRPDPRAIIPLDRFHVSRSLRRRIRAGHYRVTRSTVFEQVMLACADRLTTWITPDFVAAYVQMHRRGLASSIEIWDLEGNLTGGTYGVELGGVFFAESMFHRSRDASKLALYHLVDDLRARRFLLLECQFLTPHLASLGAVEISNAEFQLRLGEALR